MGSSRQQRTGGPFRIPQSSSPSQYQRLECEGIAHLQTQRWKQAALSLAAAIQIEPGAAGAIANLGVALFHLGDPQRAAVCYRKALEITPCSAAAHSNLGQALFMLGDATEAATHLLKAIEIEPKLADAWIHLGATLNALGQHDTAGAASHRALALAPDNLEAALNLGNAFRHEGLLREAAQCYSRVVALAPDDPRALNNLGHTCRDQGNNAAARRAYEAALAACPADSISYSNLLHLHASTRDITPESELALACQYERHFLTPDERTSARAAAAPDACVFDAEPLGAGVARRKLRLGIVFAELGVATVTEFLEPVLKALDRSCFHLTLFDSAERDGDRTTHLRDLADHFIPLTSLRDEAAVRHIRRERIDVLMDISGHTTNNRLGVFARRAAPVQCTWLGYWSTTGLTEMDYALVDSELPHALDSHFAEQLWRLPRIANCYRGDPTVEVGWEPHPKGKIRLGSFARYGDIREATMALWASTLHAVPESILLLEDQRRNETQSHARIREVMAAHSIPAERIEFLAYDTGHERHMRRYHQLDIALDTMPCNGRITAFEALWMGVPVVALDGKTAGARTSRSTIAALGKPEWIARNAAEYAAIARGLATMCVQDGAPRVATREALRAHMAASPLCDVDSFTRALEKATEAMFEQWLFGSADLVWPIPRVESVGETGWKSPSTRPAA